MDKLIYWFAMLSLFSTMAAYAQLPDPTRPLGNTIIPMPIAEKDGLQVNAIFTSSQRYVAIVNGVIVKKNDVINGYRVVNIEPHAVKFQGPNGLVIKDLAAPFVKYSVIKHKAHQNED